MSSQTSSSVNDVLPGYALMKLLRSIGIEPHLSCRCKETMAKMNEWGVAGCKLPQNYCYIVTTMEDDAKKYNWKAYVTAAKKAAQTGLLFKLNPFSSISGLVDYAIRLAEEAEPPSGTATTGLLARSQEGVS
jgi:hypothetical protein